MPNQSRIQLRSGQQRRHQNMQSNPSRTKNLQAHAKHRPKSNSIRAEPKRFSLAQQTTADFNTLVKTMPIQLTRA